MANWKRIGLWAAGIVVAILVVRWLAMRMGSAAPGATA